ncbi:MAG: glycosyltransferase family 2 protein [Bacteroidota bacterium]
MKKQSPSVSVIIPALNEENAIGFVLEDIPMDIVEEVIVVDNGSVDKTIQVAKKKGATVLLEKSKGYGNACLKGMDYIEKSKEKPDIIVFLDADYSDYPEDLPKLINPIISGKADLVIGSRALGKKEKGSMTIPQIFGNWLATSLLKMLYKVKYTDLGPFRAIKYSSLIAINMEDRNYGWTVEMQLKAAKLGLQVLDVPVNYKRRIGVSKVSGTVKGTVLAGYKILYTIFRYL